MFCYDCKKEIIIEGETDEFSCGSSIDAYKFNSWSFKSSGIVFSAKNRDTKERGKLLSSPFQINNHFKIDEDQYNNMLDEYYNLWEWDVKTGRQTKTLLERLGMKEIADRLAKKGKIVKK